MAKTHYNEASNGITFAYRRLTEGGNRHLRYLYIVEIHFQANTIVCGPALVNNIASRRTVILFKRPRFGRTHGQIRTTYND